MKTSEITFKVTVDENNLPVNIEWDAPDSGEKSKCNGIKKPHIIIVFI